MVKWSTTAGKNFWTYLAISGVVRGSWYFLRLGLKTKKTNLDFPRVFDNPFAKYLISQSFFNALAVFLVIYQSQSKHSKKMKEIYGTFLWMEFNCLKARVTSKRQLTFD